MSARAFALVFLLLLAFDARAEALSGSLTIVGSDTLSTLVLRWSDAFRAHHPGVSIQLQTPGSASAPIALLEGAADIGAMSRPMSEEETARFEGRFGYAPTQVAVARDAIVVIVHPENPLSTITQRELDAIYSDTRRCGAASAILSWNALDPAASGRRILATGRNSASGTSEFFREKALCGGEYRADVVGWPGHGATVATVVTAMRASTSPVSAVIPLTSCNHSGREDPLPPLSTPQIPANPRTASCSFCHSRADSYSR